MKKCLSLLITIFLAVSVIFAQETFGGTQSYSLDENSPLGLQDIPIYEGVEAFEAKIEKIRNEEGREPLCLVMCGGSARAFCHVGVLKAMEQNNIVPDFIIANSMGSVIGMLYAYGFSPEKIEEIISKINLSSYFEPVLPVHGGILSVRKYEAMINQLLAEESHRVEDCTIPILLLSEDLYTKRQIWHASGDFAKVMDASFAMSVFMEPVKYQLEDKTDVLLVDSGAIDIAGLKVAEHFSSNIMISTAFYDSDLDYNNPIVIINRTMSIGKERVAVHDIKEYQPMLIRNDVEHFSFMDFQKSAQISEAGYLTAVNMMDQIEVCPHGNLSENQELLNRRKVTDSLTDKQILRVEHDVPAKISEPYAGIKFWPVFRVVDFQDSYLYDKDGLALDGFIDVPGAEFKLRANFPFSFDSVCADALINFEPSENFSANFLASYDFDFQSLKESSFYSFADINIRPLIFPAWIKSLVVTGEWKTDYTFNTSQYLFTSGLKNFWGKQNDTYLFIKPYFYLEGIDFSKMNPGVGSDVEACWNFVNHFGLGEYCYAKYGFLDSAYDVQNRNELYFVEKSPDKTFAETLILQQFKIGAYYQADFNSILKNDVAQNAGIFIRGDVSVVGLSNFIMEGGCGFNIDEKKLSGFFTLKCRM